MQAIIYWVAATESGRIGITPRPRGGDWLEDEISNLKDTGVEVLVSFLESQEVRELDLMKESIACKNWGIEFLSFPIPDFGVPLSKRAGLLFCQKLLNLLSTGKNIVVHCRQGIGRSSMMVAGVLVLNGQSPPEAFKQISMARGCSVPETPEQRRWVAELTL